MMANLRMELIEKKRIAKEYLDMYYFINFCLKMDYQRNYLLKNDKWMSFRDVMTDFRNLSTNEELKKVENGEKEAIMMYNIIVKDMKYIKEVMIRK